MAGLLIKLGKFEVGVGLGWVERDAAPELIHGFPKIALALERGAQAIGVAGVGGLLNYGIAEELNGQLHLVLCEKDRREACLYGRIVLPRAGR